MQDFNFAQLARFRRLLIILAASALLVVFALPYSLQTQTAIDDSFITSRHSRNLARGEGLVFNPGQKVLGTTTPLWALGTNWIFHLPISKETQGLLVCLFSGFLALFGIRLWSGYWFSRNSFLFWILLLSLILVPSMGDAFLMGMETGPLIFFCTLFWIVLSTKPNSKIKWLQIVLLAQAILLLRLDAVFFLGSFGLAYMIFYQFKETKPLLISGLIVIILTVSWLFFCKFIYGYYFPHSMLAKSGFFSQSHFDFFTFFKTWHQKIFELLRLDFPWPRNIKSVIQSAYRISVLGGLLIGFFHFRDLRANQKAALFGAALYLSTYSLFFTLGRAGVFPWYAHLPCFICFGVILPLQIENLKRFRFSFFFTGILLGALMMQGLVLVGLFNQKDQNAYGVGLGHYLKSAHCRSVMLEPIGYIGFFSDCAHVYDLAGLVSPEILTFRRTGNPGWFFKAVEEVKPQYIVLRKEELENNLAFNVGILFTGEKDQKSFNRNYSMVNAPDQTWMEHFSLYKIRTNEAH